MSVIEPSKTKRSPRKTTPKTKRGGIDAIGASKDGHQYHEAWLARRALGLLFPRDLLCGIAIEGLSRDIEHDAPAEAIDIADATFFYGKHPTFDGADRIEITQFKHSTARSQVPMRFSDARKTFKKFSIAEESFVSNYGKEAAASKFRYKLFTNRPLSQDLADALNAAREGREPKSEGAVEQLKQLRSAISQKDDAQKEFLKRTFIVAGASDLAVVKQDTDQVIADWSASQDILARARVGDLRDVIRNKNGAEGQQSKILRAVDVLAPLGLRDEGEFLPTKDAFPEVGDVVERAQLTEFIEQLRTSGRWLVTAEGGIGKTVFVQSLADRLKITDEVVLFDCFGGGAYRSALDERHRPERGLMHIVNELACRGLCDPILPGSSEPTEVIRTATGRFKQGIETLRRTLPDARIVVILDASDNAADEASRRHQLSFPKELLRGLSHLPDIEGLIVIATARPERRDLAIGDAKCALFMIAPFTKEETSAFVLARRPEASPAHLRALQARSEGNPRVLLNLIEPDRPLEDGRGPEGKVQLDDLIEDRIGRAIGLADSKGAKGAAIAAFLCALGVLPPPVPIDEMANAFGLSKAEIASLAADLSPLLERTTHGLTFRDEPTETLVKRRFASQLALLDDVVDRLMGAQGESVYAARALPLLLLAMGRVDELRRLAFDTRFPPSLDSDVPKRAIRLIRVKMALGAAAQARDFGAATDLLVELSSLTLVNERGDQYLSDNVDLVIGLGDPEAARRLFEMKLGWAGRRHARLAIAYALQGELGLSYGHAVRTDEWIRWSHEQKDNFVASQRADESIHVAIPLYLLLDGRLKSAASYVGWYRSEFGFQLAQHLCSLLSTAHVIGAFDDWPKVLRRLHGCKRASSALLSACLPHIRDTADAARILRQLSASNIEEQDSDRYVPREQATFRASLLSNILQSCSLGMDAETRTLLQKASPKRYEFWTLSDLWPTTYVLPWVLAASAEAVLAKRELSLFDCLPSQLWRLVEGKASPASLAEQQTLIEQALKDDPPYDAGRDGDVEKKVPASASRLSSSDRYRVGDRIKGRIIPALTLGNCVVRLLSARSPDERKAATQGFCDSWRLAMKAAERSFESRGETARFIDEMYSGCALKLLPSTLVIDSDTGSSLEDCLDQSRHVYVDARVQFVACFAKWPACHAHAGRVATTALRLIKLEDDIHRRAQLFASLARAILPASKSEAMHIFKAGLRELDAIGSGDFQFTNELLNYAASIRGGPVSSVAALRFAKICELSNYDSGKFPWPSAARAFSRIWGVKYLAQIARWHDRDKANLDLSLPTALTCLIRDKEVPPLDGVLLLGLVDPVPMWGWEWRDLFEAVIVNGGDERDLAELLIQIERSYPTGLPGRYLTEVKEVVAASPFGKTAVAKRLGQLDAERGLIRQMERNSHCPTVTATPSEEMVRRKEEGDAAIDAAVLATDPLSAASLERLVAVVGENERGLNAKTSAFGTLRARVPYGDREKHVEAIALTRNLELFSKNELLKTTREAWTIDSPSGLKITEGLAADLVSAHAEELMSAEWGFTWELNKLAELTGTPRSDLAINLVVQAITRDLPAAATTWLNLASLTGTLSNPAIPRMAFERLLGEAAGRLADEVGDGPWSEALDPGPDPDEVVAGLIWFSLGSPEAVSRWRAAHVVRNAAARGRWGVVDKLFERFASEDGRAGAFQDQKLSFFALHAKYWFLVAVARLSANHPGQMFKYAAVLEAVVLNDGFPHAGFRQLAASSLQSCLRKDESPEAKTRLGRIDAALASQFPKRRKHRVWSGGMWDRPKNARKSEHSFYFEYDFEKYQLSNLGRLFDIAHWQAADRCAGWVRRLSPDVKSMHDFAGREERYSDSRREGTSDRFHCYGTYVAWHGLALAAGELFLERPVAGVAAYEESWDDFNARLRVTRKDGLWLSDGTDSYPIRARHDLSGDSGSERRPIDDEDFLLGLADIGKTRVIDQGFIAKGSWSSPDGIQVAITTALVPADLAKVAAAAAGTAPEFHIYLPTLRAYEDEDDRQSENGPFTPWVSTFETYARLDEFDPFGSCAAVERYRLSTKINRKFGLTCYDPWSAVWRDRKGATAYTAEAWGARSGSANADPDRGNTLTCRKDFLLPLLKADGCALVILIKLQRYIDRDRSSADYDGTGKFVHSWLTAVIDQKGRVKVVTPSKAQRQIVKRLPHHDTFALDKRFEALVSSKKSLTR